jgi:hypothetical protein
VRPAHASDDKLKGVCRTSVILDPKQRAPYAVEILFNASWLDAKAENDREERTNREVQIAVGGYFK